VLIGMMGAGKTTVGRALAARRGWSFVDSDAQIEARTGRTVAQIWAAEGEPAFRRLESEVLAEALAAEDPSVVAAAGGVVLDPVNRARIRQAGPVVWLRADPATLARRVRKGDHRPLLDSGPAEVLARLAAERGDLYAELADLVVDVDGLSADEVVDRIEEAVGHTTTDGGLASVRVELGERSYPVLIGPGARHRLLEVLPVGARRAAVVTQASVGVTVDAGVEQRTVLMGEGEEAKCLETVEELCREFTRFGLTRADVVVAVGGGVVTDTAGLAAALYHRGVAVIHVATTLLAQVDAAIGGKTGVNLPEGKNLVGAFWQPAAVLCDTEVLQTLPPEEYRSGLGEMAKYHFLTDSADFADLPLAEKVARCVAIKAAFVTADEREDPSGGRPAAGKGSPPSGGGRGWGPARGGEAASQQSRAVLNYGHTLAHALETAGHYDLRHGEAVAIGLVFAARLARRLGRIDDDRVAEHVSVVESYGLPTAVPPSADPAELLRLMAHDKKALEGFTFVLDGPGGPEVVTGVDRRDIEAVIMEGAL
jgi:5-deoxy-5-amino-3-dehydroquinate synthase